MGSAIGSAAVTDSTVANGIGGGIDDRKVERCQALMQIDFLDRYLYRREKILL